MRVQFSNLTEVQLALAEKREELKAKLIEATEKACEVVVESAQNKCPADTGELRQMIRPNSVTISFGRVKGIVGANTNYAIYVHEGTGIYSRSGRGRQDVPWSYQDEQGVWHQTSGIRPTPFLEQARDECQGRISEIFADIVGDFAAGGGT